MGPRTLFASGLILTVMAGAWSLGRAEAGILISNAIVADPRNAPSIEAAAPVATEFSRSAPKTSEGSNLNLDAKSRTAPTSGKSVHRNPTLLQSGGEPVFADPTPTPAPAARAAPLRPALTSPVVSNDPLSTLAAPNNPVVASTPGTTSTTPSAAAPGTPTPLATPAPVAPAGAPAPPPVPAPVAGNNNNNNLVAAAPAAAVVNPWSAAPATTNIAPQVVPVSAIPIVPASAGTLTPTLTSGTGSVASTLMNQAIGLAMLNQVAGGLNLGGSAVSSPAPTLTTASATIPTAVSGLNPAALTLTTPALPVPAVNVVGVIPPAPGIVATAGLTTTGALPSPIPEPRASLVFGLAAAVYACRRLMS